MIDARRGGVLRPREVRRLGKVTFFQLHRLPRGGSCVAVSEGEKDSVRLSAPLLILIQGPMTPQGPLRGIWRSRIAWGGARGPRGRGSHVNCRLGHGVADDAVAGVRVTIGARWLGSDLSISPFTLYVPDPA